MELPDFEPSPFEREYGRHLAISHPVADFPVLKRRLAAEGAELIPPERETPFARFFFRDPNGYAFEVVAAERRPRPERGREGRAAYRGSGSPTTTSRPRREAWA